VRFIRVSAGTALKVSDVVAAIPASRRSLEQRLRRAVGWSVHGEILRVRLARARIPMRSTDARVFDVAAEAGFSTPRRS